MSEKLDCAIVRDLLPLFRDDVVSETTKITVQAHLETCALCASELEALNSWHLEEKKTIAERFDSLRRKLRRKRIVAVLLAVILTCTILIGAGVVAHQVPLVPITEQELTVYCAYRYEVEGKPFFFVLYNLPAYSGFTHGKFDVIGDEEAELAPLTLQVKWEKTLLARPLEWTTTDFWVFSAEGMNAQKEDATFTQLRFADQVIWSEEENGTDAVPAYVYALHGFYKGQPGHPINGFFEDVENGYLGVYYEDGRRMVWDLEGNVLSDEYPDENDEYPVFY